MENWENWWRAAQHADATAAAARELLRVLDGSEVRLDVPHFVKIARPMERMRRLIATYDDRTFVVPKEAREGKVHQ